MRRALLLLAAALVLAAGRLAAQVPAPPPPDTTRRDTVRVDSVAIDSARVDSLAVDTAAVDSARADTLAQDTTPPVALRPLRVLSGFRRTPHAGLDPFRHAMIAHWGLVISAGATATTNALNFEDIGALKLLADNDSLTAETALDAIGLVPRETGLLGLLQGGGGVHLGGPFGSRFGLGFSVQGRAYGSLHADDDLITLLRDGNGARQDFTLGGSRGAALATAEAGAHAVLRFGATGDRPGPRLILGVGARFLKPLAYGRGGAAVPNSGTIRITGDSIVLSNVQAESDWTTASEDDPLSLTGSGMANDLLLRLELPHTGLALEASLTNVGKVTIEGVERRRMRIASARAASLTEFRNILMYRDTSIVPRPAPTPGVDTTWSWKLRPEYDFNVYDTASVTVTLPRVLRFAASAWVLPMLQLDAAYTAEVTGDFAMPAIVEAGATLRLIRPIPIRIGIVRAGDYGSGLTGGIGIEGRVLYLELQGSTFGGSTRTATGAGGRVEFGLFF